MQISRLLTRQSAAGFLFIAIGGGALILAPDYPAGTARRMGPGFFPIVVTILLIMCGATAVVRSVVSLEPVHPGRARLGVLAMLTAGVVFGVLVERAGLLAALLGLVLLVCLPRLRTAWAEVLAIFAFLSILIVGVFVFALGLPISIF